MVKKWEEEKPSADEHGKKGQPLTENSMHSVLCVRHTFRFVIKWKTFYLVRVTMT